MAAAFVALAGTPAVAAADPLEIHVVAHMNLGQVSGVQVPEDGGPWRRTDDFGVITVQVNPGEVLHVSRDAGSAPPFLPGRCAAPEDPGGVAYTVPDPVPTSPLYITLPDAAEPFQPGMSDKESWLVGQLNKVRAVHNLPPLTVSSTMMAAADETAHASVLGGEFPPPHCLVLLQDAGWPGLAANTLDDRGTDPVAALKHWDGTDGSAGAQNRANQGVLNASNAYIGVADANGWFIAEFQTASGCPQDAQARCGIENGNQGDPNAWTPPTTGPGSGGTGGGTSSVPDAKIRGALSAFSTAPELGAGSVTAALTLPVAGSLSWRLQLTPRHKRGAARKIVLGSGTIAIHPGPVRLQLNLSRPGKAALHHARGGKVTVQLVLTTSDGRVFHVTAPVKLPKR